VSQISGTLPNSHRHTVRSVLSSMRSTVMECGSGQDESEMVSQPPSAPSPRSAQAAMEAALAAENTFTPNSGGSKKKPSAEIIASPSLPAGLSTPSSPSGLLAIPASLSGSEVNSKQAQQSPSRHQPDSLQPLPYAPLISQPLKASEAPAVRPSLDHGPIEASADSNAPCAPQNSTPPSSIDHTAETTPVDSTVRKSISLSNVAEHGGAVQGSAQGETVIQAGPVTAPQPSNLPDGGENCLQNPLYKFSPTSAPSQVRPSPLAPPCSLGNLSVYCPGSFILPLVLVSGSANATCLFSLSSLIRCESAKKMMCMIHQ
jgi:hypothetical protein